MRTEKKGVVIFSISRGEKKGRKRKNPRKKNQQYHELTKFTRGVLKMCFHIDSNPKRYTKIDIGKGKKGLV